VADAVAFSSFFNARIIDALHLGESTSVCLFNEIYLVIFIPDTLQASIAAGYIKLLGDHSRKSSHPSHVERY